MNIKKFNLSEILSITTGRLVTKNGMTGVYNILEHMENMQLSATGLVATKEHNTKILEALYPELSIEALKHEVKDLDLALKTSQNKEETVSLWLSVLEKKLGDEFFVPQQFSLENLHNSNSLNNIRKFKM